MALDFDKDYLVSLVKGILEADYLCDVTLVAGLDKRRFPVHRIVMVASSPYFKAMLVSNFKEANQEEVVLNAIDGATLSTVIKYCYSGSAQINEENVGGIMSAASSMMFVQLKEKCANFLRQRLGVENSIEILLIADQYNLTGLRNNAMQFICANFAEIPSADMVKLDEKMFGEILEQGKIVADETVIFDRLVQWSEHDASKRSQFVALLAKSIRLEYLPTEFLTERVESFYENHGCGELVSDEKMKRTQKLKEKIGVSRFRQPMLNRRYQPKLYLADVKGPQKINVFIHTGEYFNTDLDKFKTVSIDTPRKNRIFYGGKIYLFDDANGAARDMDVYDLITSKKEVMPDMPLGPIFGSPISIGKYTYVLGNQWQAHDEVSFTSCYRFDSERKLWEVREPLPHRFMDLSAVEMDGLIFITGKIEKTQNYASNFWCYDPSENVWTAKAHTNLDKRGLELFKSLGSICVCKTGVGFVKYDLATNRWTKINFKPSPLYKRKRADYDYVLYDAVDFEDESCGLMKVDEGNLFAEIHMRGKHCSFDDDYLDCIELHLDVSGGRKHLFIH